MEDPFPSEPALNRAEAPSPEAPPPPPPPSYAPFLLALGITMLFLGLATSPVMSAGGLVIFIWALWTWIREIAQAWRN